MFPTESLTANAPAPATANAPAPATAAAVLPTLHKSPPPPSSLASDTLAPASSEANVPPVLEYGLAYPPQGSALSDDVTQALPCAQAYTFASYLDQSGIDAPDGVREIASDTPCTQHCHSVLGLAMQAVLVV